jgi:hypothetical protein
MSRLRGPIKGGYVRKTVSLPASLVQRIEHALEGNPGMTISAFLSISAEAMVDQNSNKRKP